MQIGDILNQRYTLTTHLGTGAMGDVYQATDSQTSQTVAVKVLDRKLTLDPEIVERFKREGEALRQLRHRHIVGFVDTFQHERQQVIVMECVSGGNLHQLIKRGPLPVEQARQIAIDLCDALTSAHRLNIVHRDIKPENVLIAQDGTPKLTDFGVARLVSEGTRLTGTGTQIGTPFYMSPEAWQGQPLDAQADIWSLGIVLYEMLTGGVPFGGDTLVAVMNKVLTTPMPDLKKLRPETPSALVKIVRRMLERDRAKRYQSLREVGLDLERVMAVPTPAPVAPLSVTAPNLPETRAPLQGNVLPGNRKRWALVGGGLALALVLCLLAAGGGALAMKMIGQMTPPAASQPTAIPAQPTAVPVQPTAVPVQPTAVRVQPTAVPVQPTAAPPAGKVKVGLSFSDLVSGRWKNEKDLLEKLLKEKGYEVVWQEANHDMKLQNDQIDNMVTQGAKVLIIIAEDGDAAATAVDKAAAAGVKVIAYDRLIKSPNIAAYISFNNMEVGRQQALGILKAVNIDGGKWTKANPLKLVELSGSPTDNNAHLFRLGQDQIVQPYVDKGIITVVADQWVDNWDPVNALKIMENVLTAQNNKIDAVVASNDGMALSALQALKARGLAGKVPISGQDATVEGCNSIVKGELTVSVFKDIRLLSPLAVDLVDKLLKSQPDPNLKQFTLAELTNDKSRTGAVMAYFLPVQQVTKDNVYDLIVVSGYQSYEDVYRDIPAAQRPPKPGEATAAPPAGKVLVGLSFSDFATERWKTEEVLMEKLLKEKGYDVVFQEANHDVKLQNDQIDNMVTQGAKALIIIAEDGDAAATAANKAAAAGVKVIAYDRLIKSVNISAYISFNNMGVGRQEALGVINALKMDSGKWTTANPVKLMLMGGSPTDNNAILVRQGQEEVLKPYIDAGTIKVVADQWVDNWDAANALKIMENVLTAQNNKIDAVVASNDGTALGALQALKAQGLAGKVPISGQDATADGCNSIVKGEQTVSVFKDIRLLSPLAVDLVDKLIKGQPDPNLKQFTLAELTNDKSKIGTVMAYFLPVQQVTKDNVYDLIVKSGFQSYDDVYRDIPAAQRPPKP